MAIPLVLPLALASLLTTPASAPAPESAPWVLPNFAERLELDVLNDGDAPVDTLAVVSIADASRTALRFPGTLAIVVVPGSLAGSPGSATAPSFLPSQIDDLDGNGTADELVFPIALGAKESRRVHVYYSVTLRDELPWPKRVHASHAFGYNRATAALESEVIGYRTYGGFFLDVQGRAEGQAGLHNTLLGYAGSRLASAAGRDVIHLGDTLGLGGLFLRSGATAGATAGGTVVRPPLNVPDYAHKPSPPDVPIYRVIASGPLRAIVEARLDRWRVSESETVSVRAAYTIAAGAAHVECRFQITPVRIDREYEAGAGVRHLPAMSSDHDRAIGRLALAGTESAAIGPLGLALYYDPASAAAAPALVTKEASNDIVVFRDRLAPGRAVEGRYSMAAAWSGSGVGRGAGDLMPYLRRVEQQARAAVRVANLRHARTPNPDAIEGEAH